MTRTTILLSALLLGATLCQSVHSATPKQPFHPTLTVNDEPQVCARFLDAYRTDFMSNDLEIRLSGLNETGSDDTTASDFDGDGHADRLVYTVNMTRGSHEGYAVWALPADAAVPEFPDTDLFGDGESRQAVAAEARAAMQHAPRIYPAQRGAADIRVEWRYLPSQIVRIHGHWYSIERSQWSGDDAYEPTTLFAIRPGFKMEPVCTIGLRDAQGRTPEQALETVPTRALQHLLDKMSGGEGDCGTGSFLIGRIHARHRAERRAILRPWVMGDDSFPEFALLLAHWKYDSPDNMAVAERTPGVMRDTRRALKKQYVEEFGSSAAEAEALADRAVTSLVRSGFSAYSGIGDPEQRVRQETLSLVSTASRIRARNLPVLEPQTGQDAATDPSRYPDTMHFAVWNPRVIDDLVRIGFDVDGANGFGKTALMYAAQQDNVQALRALLRAGANVHATTTQGEDRCYHGLRRERVTALHYAVRYGSRRVVEALLDAGANPAATDSDQKSAADWLDLYGANNPNIDEPDISRLRTRLRTSK